MSVERCCFQEESIVDSKVCLSSVRQLQIAGVVGITALTAIAAACLIFIPGTQVVGAVGIGLKCLLASACVVIPAGCISASIVAYNILHFRARDNKDRVETAKLLVPTTAVLPALDDSSKVPEEDDRSHGDLTAVERGPDGGKQATLILDDDDEIARAFLVNAVPISDENPSCDVDGLISGVADLISGTEGIAANSSSFRFSHATRDLTRVSEVIDTCSQLVEPVLSQEAIKAKSVEIKAKGVEVVGEVSEWVDAKLPSKEEIKKHYRVVHDQAVKNLARFRTFLGRSKNP